MRRILLFITVSIMLSIVPAPCAQVEQGAVAVKLNSVALKGNALNLDMYMIIENIPVKRYESLVLTVTLRGAGKGQTLALPPVIVNGANKRQMFERVAAINGLVEAKNGAYAVLKNDPALIQYLGYKRAVAYKSWMDNCQLVLIGEFKDYNNNTTRRFTDTFVRRLAIRRVAGAPTNENTINIPPANATDRQPSNTRLQPPATNRQQQPATNRQPSSTTRPATRQPANSSTRPTVNNAAVNRQPANVNNARSTTRQSTNAATNRQTVNNKATVNQSPAGANNARPATRQPANATTNRQPANSTNNNRR
ncbi:MAG: DUF3868 domain-containing protein [Tannerellaceae bacterium]|jgi:hypothetical protein|nr:DUF3868 domain-containing protein [Tannerellaceae bacterium]